MPALRPARPPLNGFPPLASVLLILLASCAGAPVKKGPFPFDALKKNSESRAAMSGTIRITQTVEGKSITIPGVLLVEWPGQLRLELQDPVGSVLALLVVNEGRFWLYQQNGKENLTGPLAQLPAGFAPPFAAEDLARVFLARPDLEKFRAATADGNQAELPGGKETLRWNTDRWQIEEWVKKIPGSGVNRAAYSDFEAKSGRLYPTKVRLSTRLGEKAERSALVVWVDWEPSVFDKKLFQIPPSRDFGRKTKALP